MVGAAVAKAGFGVLVWEGIRTIAVFIVLAPLAGLAASFVLMVVVLWSTHRYHKVETLNRGFRHMQLVSAGAYSLGHGANDAQKTMGVILALLIADRRGRQERRRPVVGRALGPHRHRARHPHRRLAHREDHGHRS